MTRLAFPERARFAPSSRLRAPLSCALLLLGLALAGCGGGSTHGATAPLEARRLYPLGDGYVWSYDIDTGVPPPSLGVFRVTGHQGNRFEVRTNTDPIQLEVRGEGIYRVDRDVWLLRNPIRVGAEWPSALGGSAHITDVHASVETGEGTLRECVEVVEASTDRRQRSVYCPDLGLALLEIAQQLPIPGHDVTVTARLRGHSFEQP